MSVLAVFPQIVSTYELGLTEMAFKRFFSSVTSQMALQIYLLREPTSTYSTPEVGK